MEHIRQPGRQPLKPPIYVLIVDDVQNNITALEASLARPDISVLAAGSGPAALELLLKHGFVYADHLPDRDRTGHRAHVSRL